MSTAAFDVDVFLAEPNIVRLTTKTVLTHRSEACWAAFGERL